MGIETRVDSTNFFDKITESIFANTIQGMNQAAEHLLAKSLEQVPMDVGTLAASGAATHARSIDEPATVSYDTPYAARLHEHPEYNFSKDSNPGAKGKYLEDPAVENKDQIGRIIEAAAKRGELNA